MAENEEDKKPSVYSPEFIPFYKDIQKNYHLTTRDVLIYGFIRFYLKTVKGESFFFSNESLAKVVGYKNSNNAGLCINKLEELGFIKCIYKMKGDGGQIRFIQWESDDPKKTRLIEINESNSLKQMSLTHLNKRGNNNKTNISTTTNSIKDKKTIDKVLPDLMEQELDYAKLFEKSKSLNLLVDDVIKKYFYIRGIIERGEFNPKWGGDISRILSNWLGRDKKEGKLEEMGDFEKLRSEYFEPGTVEGNDLWARALKAHSEGKI